MAQAKTRGVKKKENTTSSSSKVLKIPQDVLLKEIIELGGTEADLELVQGIESDVENCQESGAAPAKAKGKGAEFKLPTKDLKSFIAELGFDKLQRPDLDSDDEQAQDLERVDENSQDGISGSSSAQSSDDESNPPPTVGPIKSAATLTPQNGSASKSSSWIVVPHPLWHSVELPELSLAPESYTLTPETIAALEQKANTLLLQVNAQYTDSLSPKSKSNFLEDAQSTLTKADKSFIVTILQSGTSSDKLSALTLLASSSPLHCTAYLTQLLALCAKKNREESTKAIRSVVDWLKGQGLPADRKLKWFADQPGLRNAAYSIEKAQKKKKVIGHSAEDQYLVVWAFEHWLKKWYLDLLRVLETLSNDPLPFIRTQTVGHLSGLLADKPEQEHNLLVLLANKLGDVNRPLASLTSHHLLQLLQTHPLMKPIIIREVAALVLRPPPASSGKDDSSVKKHDHARYYGLITLNQILLNKNDKAIAAKLIDIYFQVFSDILKRLDSVARPAERTSKKRSGKKEKKQDLALKAELEEEGDSKLLAAVLTGVNRAFPYADSEEEIMRERMNTLFRITHTGSFNVSIQALSLIFNVAISKQSTSDRFYRSLYESLLDPRLADSSKQTLYLNLLFRAINIDTSMDRIMAFIKRLLQSLTHHSPPYIVGSLHLLGELFKSKPALASLLSSPEDHDTAEAFKDVGEDRNAEVSGSEAEVDSTNKEVLASKLGPVDSMRYDARKREPQFAHAQLSCLWDLIPLTQHFHPSVARHSSELLANQSLSTTQDLEQHTFTNFLDRFVYRDPKKAGILRGVSAMQPAVAGQNQEGRVLLRKGVGLSKHEQMNSDQFWRRDQAEVPPDQLFFHCYFVGKHGDASTLAAKAELRKNKKRRRDEEDNSGTDVDQVVSDGNADGSVLGSDDEDEIWQAMKASLPKQDKEAIEDDDADSQIDIDSDDSSLGSLSDEEEDGPPIVQSAFDAEVREEASVDSDSSLDFGEDDDDLLDSDVEMSDINLSSSDKEEPVRALKTSGDGRHKKKRKMKHLPTFASADDYAKLLGGSDDEDL